MTATSGQADMAALVRAAQTADHATRPAGRNWTRVGDDQVARLIGGAQAALIAAQEPKAARADEFARVKVRLSALVASLDETVERGSHAEEFDQGAAHASAVTARQLREILNDTALGTTPQPAPDLATAMDALTKVAESHERVMYAAAIDIRHGQPGAARRLLGEQLDGWDGPQWDGTETGAQYLERTREGA